VGGVPIAAGPKAAMVMVLFQISESIEQLSMTKARRSIRDLMSAAPETAEAKDGRSWREHVPMPLGAPTNPVTDEALLRKFRGVVGMVFTEEETEELARTLMALEEVSDFRTEVASLLAREPRTREQFDA